jgi:hypothetical protein
MGLLVDNFAGGGGASTGIEAALGRMVDIRHEGVNDGYDMGWSLYPGHGGMADHCFAGWMPLPTPPAKETGHG